MQPKFSQRWFSQGKRAKADDAWQAASIPGLQRLCICLPVLLKSDLPHWIPLFLHHGCLDGLVFLLSDHSTFVLFDFPWLLRLLTQNAMILLFPVWSASSGSASFDLPDLLLPLIHHYTMKSSLMTYPHCLPLIPKLDTTYTFIWTLHRSAVKSHVTISQSHILSFMP